MRLSIHNLENVYKSPRMSVETMELKGYTLVKELFVDSSGFGTDAEPALTQSQFITVLRELIEEHGTLYSTITSAGMFQVYVGLFTKSGINKTKKLKNNTLGIYENGELVAIRLHDTNIIEYQGNYIVLNSGGWQTNTTKKRINEYLPGGFRIVQRSYEWFVIDRDGLTRPFTDGMKISI